MVNFYDLNPLLLVWNDSYGLGLRTDFSGLKIISGSLRRSWQRYQGRDYVMPLDGVQ
jgi:hypothetical protein